MDQQTIDARQNRIAIEADVSLLERERDKILADLEQLQNTQKEAHLTLDKQLSVKKGVLENISIEIAQAKALCDKYNQTLAELKDLLKDFGKKEIDEALDRLKVIDGDINVIRKEFIDRENNIAEREKKVLEERRIAARQAAEAERVKKDYHERDLLLDTRERTIDNREKEAKAAVVKANELLDTINGEIKSKRMQVQRIDITIETKTKQAENIGIEAEGKLKEATRRLKEISRKEEALREKDDKLTIRETKVADREATVGRAYREVIQRGGVVEEPPQPN